MKITYIGGPTALLEVDGFRLLTDPTFDPAPHDYTTGPVTLTKHAGPAIGAEQLGRIDAVLLSHDHHADNLDQSGRAVLASAAQVITTPAGAERLGGNATGLAAWQSTTLRSAEGRTVRVTSTPARHGPAHMDRGPVTGFVLESASAPSVYVSGDTVWYEGVEKVAARFEVSTVVLFLGAAKLAVVGPWHLTMTAEEGVLAARAFPNATIIPVHYEGWRHFSEGRAEIERTFAAAGLDSRLLWAPRGEAVSVPDRRP